MPLSRFQIGNYRGFVEPASVALKPLTLLFGYNNAGKSALARVLPLLRDSLRSRAGLPLDLDSQAVRGGEFRDLRSRLTEVRKISLVLEWTGELFESAEYAFQDLPEKRQHIIDTFQLVPRRGPKVEGTWIATPDGPIRRTEYEMKQGGNADGKLEIVWEGIRPGLGPTPPGSISASNLVASRPMFAALEHLLWLGAVRSMQPRTAKFPRSEPRDIDVSGLGAGDVLAWDKKYGGAIFKRVAEWYGAHAGVGLDIAEPPDGYSLVTGLHQVSLSDTGEGLTQVLPVLVAGAMAAERSETSDAFVVLEQPELHLHPRLHAPLASFFCAIAAANPRTRTVIETHSENFLFGVQLAVARGDLRPQDVLIHWVRQGPDGRGTVEPMPFDEEARPQGWPKGVFSEEVDLAKELFEARNARAKQK